MSILESVIPVKQQFLDSLSALDNLVLQGSLLVDFSIIASIPSNLISGSNYEDIAVSVLINSFEASVSCNSIAFSLDFPLTLPSNDSDGTTISFGLTDASFSMDFFVNTQGPTHIIHLFPGDQDDPNLGIDYGGTLQARFPMIVGIEGVNIAVDLLIDDQNLFAPDPVVDYVIDMCDVSSAISDLFDQLKIQIVQVVSFENLVPASININTDKITDPLVERVETALSNFTDGVNNALSSPACGRRFLETIDTAVPSESPSSSSIPSSSPTQATKSLKETIQDAISSVNAALSSAGIVLSAEVTPYFDSSSFSVGVVVGLRVTIEQTAIEVIELVSGYISSSTDPSGDSTVSKLGLGSSSDALVIDLNELLSEVSLAAGLDITFGIDLGLTQIQDAIFNDTLIVEALQTGIELHVNMWEAFAEIIVDPIDLVITLFGEDIQVRDSHFALAAKLRSRGKFEASVHDMIIGGDGLDTSMLIPDLALPLSTEFIFDIPATESITISPIISVKSVNLVDEGLLFNYDIDFSTFLNEDVVGGATLLTVLQNATAILQQVADLQPELNVTGNGMSALDGFFSVVDQLNDLGGDLSTFIDVVNQGV